MQLSSAQFNSLIDREITQIQFGRFFTPDKYREAWYTKIEPLLDEWEKMLAESRTSVNPDDEIPF